MTGQEKQLLIYRSALRRIEWAVKTGALTGDYEGWRAAFRGFAEAVDALWAMPQAPPLVSLNDSWALTHHLLNSPVQQDCERGLERLAFMLADAHRKLEGENND